MTTPRFRQLILPRDRGSDVIATKLAMRAMGHKGLRVGSNLAGHRWEQAVRAIQHNHGETADGIYGRRTHEVVARHMGPRARLLYERSKIRSRSSGYRNPFAGVSSLVVGRIDEGVDYFGVGPIRAIGDAVIVGKGGSGWPGGQYLCYRLTSGRHAGRYIYIAEGISIPATIFAGRHVKAGDAVCAFRWDAAPGHYPGIEFGWSSGTLNVTWAAATHQLTPRPYNDTPPGLAFARFLKEVGAPAPPAGSGPEFV